MEREDRLTDLERQLYQRHLVLEGVGETGQLKLLESRVLIVGLGGLGSPALLYLSACGVGEIGVVDGDRVELSNLQRQILHGRADVGKEKTTSAQETIAGLRPDIRLNLHPVTLSAGNAEEIIAPYDFVIEATDNFAAKFLVNDVCVRLGKAFSHAGILGMYGQTLTVVPGRGPCVRCVFEGCPEPGAVPTTKEAGVLGSVPGVFGALQATEAIKHLVGYGDLLVGRLLSWDAVTMRFREVRLSWEKPCALCLRAASESGEAPR